LDHQNNYVERLSVDGNVAKNFNTLATSLIVPHNYFDVIQTKLFSDLYLAKFFKYFSKTFPCRFLKISENQNFVINQNQNKIKQFCDVYEVIYPKNSRGVNRYVEKR